MIGDGKVTVAPSGKRYLTSSNPFEIKFGYHRAVRKGPFIFVSGTTALKLVKQGDGAVAGGQGDDESKEDKDSKVHHPTSAYKQATLAMKRSVEAVHDLGGKDGDIVRVRMYVSRHEDCGEIGDAYRECFAGRSEDDGMVSEVGAVATMVVVQNGFVDQDILVEVEVDAVVCD